MATDRENLEEVARLYREYASLMNRQRATTVEMLRGCIARLKSPDSRKRAEAVKALGDLADLLEDKREGS